MFTFGVYDSTGAPFSGLAGSLTWHIYVQATTGVTTTGPGFAELGSSGMYETSADPAYAGLIDCTSSANARYVLVAPASGFVFPAFRAGSPQTGLVGSLLWQSLYDTSTGLPISPQFGFTELGSGLYRVNGLTSTATGRIDLGSLQSPRYYEADLASDVTAPTLTSPTPAPGTTIVSPQVLGFTSTGTGLAVEVTATYPSGAVELIYGPTLGGFSTLYQSSQSPALLNGGWSIVRTGGWPASPTLLVSARDVNGNAASANWSWLLATSSSASGAVSTSGAVVSGTYGVDVRTFVDTGNGLDVDPFLRFEPNPQIVMVEAITRRLTMQSGQLFYAPSAGYSLQNLINTTQTAQSLQTIGSQIQQELFKDPRVQDANVTVTQSPGVTQALTVSITGLGAAGPFSCVYSVSALTVSLLSFS